MKWFNGFAAFFALWFVSFAASAQEFTDHEDLGRYTVNYSVFNSQFVPAEIAAAHNLVRAKDKALINVSIIEDATGKTVKADVSGEVRNLMQQNKQLDFKTISEPGAEYYIASLRHTNEEILHFYITLHISGEDAPETIKFTRKLYVEP